MDAGEQAIEKYRSLIQRDFPDFEISDVKYLGSGWDNAALLVNGEYVFRFLRGLFDQDYPLKTEEIEKEVKVLKFLSDKVSFAVPKPDFVAPDFHYFGYKLIAGTLWDNLGEGQFDDHLLKDWVRVRSEISKAVPAEKADELKIPKYRTSKNEQLVNEYLADATADPRVQAMAKAAMDYVCTHCASNPAWVFVHEDLQMSNCMIDPTSQKITGVIDWLEAEIAPVEAEFYFWSKYGQERLEQVAKIQQDYDGTHIDTRLARAIHQFYITADYVDFKYRGYEAAAAHKWKQIEAYL
jgi:aminoglycoside 2''-phosphotransferase